MSRIDNVIELVKEYRTGKNRPWIYNEDGSINNNAIVADVLPILRELKEYEINVSDDFFDNFLEKADDSFNTYNWNSPISNDIACHYIKNDECCVAIMMIHLFGDARAHYTDWFAVKFDSYEELFELESCYQTVEVSERYAADVCIWSDCYSVYDYKEYADAGEYYEIEKADLLKEIKEKYENA